MEDGHVHLSICNAMQVGRLFQEVSNGQYAEKVLPYLLESAPFAGVDRVPFQQALQTAVRDKPQVLAPTKLCGSTPSVLSCLLLS